MNPRYIFNMTQSLNLTQPLLLADGGPPPESIYSFFMIMMVFVTIVVLLTVVYVIKRAFDQRTGEVGGWEMRGAFGRIRAVARITLAEAIRTKLVFGLVAIILISIPLWWLTATGDGTIKGQVQMFVAYSMGFTGFLLGLITILFSCSSLSAEIASRQIYGLVSKPIPRWQILAGKVAGVLTLDAALLTLAALATYGGVQLTLSRFESLVSRELVTRGQLTPAEAATAVASLEQVRGVGGKGMESPVIPTMANALGKTDQQIGDILLRLTEETRVNLRKYDELRRQVLVNRAWLEPEKEDVTAEVNRRIEELRNSGNLSSDLTEAQLRKQLTEAAEASSRTVPPGGYKMWVIHGPPPSKDDKFLLSIRFKLQPSHAMQAMPEADLEEETFLAAWGVGRPGTDKFDEVALPHPTRGFNEFEIPQDVVDPDGTVVVHFRNIDPRSAEAVFEKEYGLQIMYRVGSFGLSLVQATLSMFIPLICLATIGVCASTFLSPRVGTFLVIVLWILTSSMGFVSDSLAVTKDYIDPSDVSTALRVRMMTVKAVGAVLAIGDSDPISSLIIGLGMGWHDLWTNTWKFVLVKSGIVMVIAVLVFRRRELAAVIV